MFHRIRHLPLFLLVSLVYQNVVHAEDLAGWKVVNYWSITCAPCRIEIPELNTLMAELAEQEIQLVGINFDDDDRTTTLKFARRMGIEFPTLTRGEVENLGLAAPNVLPTTYIVSPDNQIEVSLVGVQTRESIQMQLNELMTNEK